jgi:hypothetical protein
MVKIGINTIVKAHLGRERLDVLLSVLIPLVLMVESGYASGWVYAGGSLVWTDANTYLALFRGFFLEALIYAMFKLTRILVIRAVVVGPWWHLLVGLLPLAIGVVTMVVSAGLNIAWANRSGEMQVAVQMVGDYMPDAFLVIFKTGVGLIFPVGVGVCALLDVGHLVEELLQSSASMDDRASRVQIAEIHRDKWMKEQEKSAKQVQQAYAQMAQADAQNMLNRVKVGDYSFGVNEVTGPLNKQSSATRILAPSPTVQLPPTQTTQFPPAQGPYQAPPSFGQNPYQQPFPPRPF